jgi:hypothetical protein
MEQLAEGSPVFIGMSPASGVENETASGPALMRYRREPQAL